MDSEEIQKSKDITKPAGTAAWVKWRGKWQACIQCSVNDCPASTVKAMPTYTKKTYVAVYFPNFQLYAWVDFQTLRAIEEKPEPLASGSHEDARQSVNDLDAPKTQMLRSLASSVCDISDRLPIKAVVEQAQDANVWKAFAKEAAQAKNYAEIGRLLVRLFGMIIRKYVKAAWLDSSYNRWKDNCESAITASCIENMNKELTSAILWEEVARLWDEPEQSTLGSEWKDWKEAHTTFCPSSKEPLRDEAPQISQDAKEDNKQVKVVQKFLKKRKSPTFCCNNSESLRKKVPSTMLLGLSDCNSAIKGLAVESIFAWHGPKLSTSPTKRDVLAAASLVCCGLHLISGLALKYKVKSNELLKRVTDLCAKENKSYEWMKDGFVCPKGCNSHLKDADLDLTFPLTQIFLPNGVGKSEEYSKALLSKKLCTFSKADDLRDGKGFRQVLCKDLSFGRESLPIPCIVDQDLREPCFCSSCNGKKIHHVDSIFPWETFSYITKRVLNHSLGIDTKNSQLGCACRERKCLAHSCDHVQLFDYDNPDACDIEGRPMQGRFPYNHRGQIILEEGYLVYECNSSCNCRDSCVNRVLQKGVQVKLEVFKTSHKGWAVRAGQNIHRGTFVCEYLGEVLNDAEANQRGEGYDRAGCSYLYDIDGHIDASASRKHIKPFVIDATKFGNVSRFINHSCAPNLINYQVLVESMDCQLAHIGLYASRDIAAGEELAYDYRANRVMYNITLSIT
ncbi:hypothetical protein O6H91_19G005900 [Diphasiastrum complanatum]|uniref:Uncharacterized protein n=2 Tax=Diphasiastrum complanatum TaxID=34168 RepID=A0ACC2ASD2_DIPCM|nr:hypothetical protein O6H91_19G005900 [Diphasiastrum complanatum]KAJ7520438.1 hypothetical protein O6H91_19G005900 [Diphasiastrum complanatum]